MRSQTPRKMLAAAAMVCAPLAAHATPPLPAATFNATLGTLNQSQSYSIPGAYSLGNLSTSIAGVPGVTLTGHAQGTDLNTFNGNGSLESSVVYYFGVDGALVGEVVPMFVSFTLQTSAIGPGNDNASARFGLTTNGFDLFNLLSESSDPGAHPNFSGTLGFDQHADTLGRITLQIDVSALGGGSADAFIDPYLYIDPDFLLTHPGYSVQVSSGVGNPAPAREGGGVPEPASWALVVLGLGALGGVLRRRARPLTA